MKRFLAAVLLILLMVPGLSKAENAQPMRILLLGTDRLGYYVVSDKEDMSRADAIMVMTVDPETGGIRILSVERDYLVTLPEGVGKNKLSTATYFGGPQMCLDAVNSLFGLDLTRYMQIDMPRAVEAMDLLGGVDVEIYADEVPIVNASPIIVPKVEAGINHFNGKKALTFMRVRDMEISAVESNKARNSRQIRVIEAFLSKLSSSKGRDLINLASGIIPLVKTNMTIYDLLLLSQSVLSSGLDFGSLSYLRTPTGPYKTKRVNMHQVVVVDDMQAEIGNVRAFLLYNKAE